MDQRLYRLFQAATMGDIVELKALQKEDKLILKRVSLPPTAETPLHVASLAGHVDFVREMMELEPSFAQELNKDGFAPIHLATAAGHLEVVKELLKKADSDLCLLKDKAGRTALHLAAIKGRVHIIGELLSKCPHQKAIEQVTSHHETVLHLAVKNSQFEAFKVLFEASEKLEDHEGRVNAKDDEGKTVLEIANATNQLQVLDLLNKDQSEDQIINIEGTETKLDWKEEDKTPAAQKTKCLKLRALLRECWGMYLGDKNLLPVMASMIGTAAFEAGLNPPSTIWEKGSHIETKCMNSAHYFRNITDPWQFRSCSGARFYGFMVCNTIAFVSSLVLIPYSQNELVAPFMIYFSLYSMLFSYIIVLYSISSSAFLHYFTLTVVLLSVCFLFETPLFKMLKTQVRRTLGAKRLAEVQKEENESNKL